MSKKRLRPRTVNAAPENDASQSRVLELPNEVLLEIWDELAPLERVCVYQVCSRWRRIALGIPKFWAQLAFVQTGRPARTYGPRQIAHSILHPAPGSCNISFFETALLRSGDFPLDLTISFSFNWLSLPSRFCALIEQHAQRIARVHSSSSFWIHCLLGIRRDWPALRTLTAGFDDRSIIFPDLPPNTARESEFPALRQIHFSDNRAYTRLFEGRKFPSVSEMSFAPFNIPDVIIALDACPCLSSLTLVFTYFRHGVSLNAETASTYTAFLERALRLHKVCVCGITGDSEPLVLAMFADSRFCDVTFDYQGCPSLSGARWDSALVSPCSPLEGPLHITLVVRERVYELAITDSAQRRRAILLDAWSIRRTRGLWDCYIRDKVVRSATVDALAWQYFVKDVPDDCPLSVLIITVGYKHTELKNVSLARLPHLTKLSIETLKPAIEFPPRVVNRLLRSRPRESPPLAALSLAPNCDFGADGTLSQLADVVEWPAA